MGVNVALRVKSEQVFNKTISSVMALIAEEAECDFTGWADNKRRASTLITPLGAGIVRLYLLPEFNAPLGSRTTGGVRGLVEFTESLLATAVKHPTAILYVKAWADLND